jgi:hypothetical protein
MMTKILLKMISKMLLKMFAKICEMSVMYLLQSVLM